MAKKVMIINTIRAILTLGLIVCMYKGHEWALYLIVTANIIGLEGLGFLFKNRNFLNKT